MAIEQRGDNFIDTTPRPAERGQAIEWGWIQVGRELGIGYTSTVDIEDVKRCLHADAARELPPGTRYELRKRSPNNYGRTNGMAWYWLIDFDKAESWGDRAPGPKEGAYWLIGQFTTPLMLNVAETTTKIGGDQ